MIVVDTSVWIDYFRGVVTPQSTNWTLFSESNRC
jgi:predicted nucleic acid-binding protein